jgi:hypothetical protein
MMVITNARKYEGRDKVLSVSFAPAGKPDSLNAEYITAAIRAAFLLRRQIDFSV